MTPEQLAIKNVGKQVAFYVNLFTMRHAIVMSPNFFSRATIVYIKKNLSVNVMADLELVVFLLQLRVFFTCRIPRGTWRSM